MVWLTAHAPSSMTGWGDIIIALPKACMVAIIVAMLLLLLLLFLFHQHTINQW